MNKRLSYRIDRSYRWNYDHAPSAVPTTPVPWPGDWQCCGWPLTAPLAVAAGPLLNGAWLRYYAQMGFDLLTYKTVRSRAWPSYPLPNLQPVDCEPICDASSYLRATPQMQGSWAVSFGMPSADPKRWQTDIGDTRAQLLSHQALAVSVVATPEPEWSLAQLADDYAMCAGQAVANGADMIELNLSCPNVKSCDGQLYRQPDATHQVARRVRECVGTTPLLLKIGHVGDETQAAQLVDAVAGVADALVMVNCLAAQVTCDAGPLFDGQRRGIAGVAIHDAAVRQVEQFRILIGRAGSNLQLIGCGGARDVTSVQRFLNAGANCVQMATAVMLQPDIALRMRQQAATRRK